MEKQIQIQLIDPFDVLLVNIEHQLELESSFRTNLN